jgi:hypothetical protein
MSVLDESGHSVLDTWLTDTAGVNETSAHLARYGDNLLVAWKAGGSLLLAVVTADGTLVDGPAPVSADIGLRDDFFNYPDGRVGWTYAGSGRGSLMTALLDLP